MRSVRWVELCCGSAAVTLRLLGGRKAVPPASYQGGKRKYAHAILDALGLPGTLATAAHTNQSAIEGLLSLSQDRDIKPLLTRIAAILESPRLEDHQQELGTAMVVERPLASFDITQSRPEVVARNSALVRCIDASYPVTMVPS